MAENDDDSQEKSEEPSQRRLEKAREDGQILTSKEVMVFATTFSGMMIFAASALLLPQILDGWRGWFQLNPAEALLDQIGTRVAEATTVFIVASLIFGVPLLIVTLVTQGFVGGLNFATKAMAFKGSRINPIAGLGRIFSIKGLMELVKSVLKVVLLGAVAVFVLWQLLPSMLVLSSAGLASASAQLFRNLLLLLAATVVLLAMIAVLDFFWSRHQHLEKLRMSRKDMRDEHKETEGSPEIKSRIRRLQIEATRRAAQSAQALEKVAEARVIVTNPTHFAVALKYDAGDAGAPIVLAMGRGRMAEMIIARGEAAGVTVLRSPLLARALFFTSEIGQEISEKLYTAVAAVLAYVYRIDRGEDLEQPEIDLPPELRFAEDGRPLEGRG
ncbi:MAG: EscU/YscU/HrcU family type III secretion system export apparatus switch protein [Alphaproteobacteria bacterium]|nr:EscU/YscU/HrcU family type III secretion system export apparatus switch protein [Alphaproteobacteria bacterium]